MLPVHSATQAVSWVVRCAALSAFLLAGASTAGFAQDFERGLEAARRGDYETALAEWRPLAEQGDANAQYSLSMLHFSGYGVPQDYAEAVRWYQLAAEQARAQAQHDFGRSYPHRHGVHQNYLEAMHWYRFAAAQGLPAAQHSLGFMYYSGYGVRQDYEEAVVWYRLAAEQGFARAQDSIGYMYQNARGVSQDYVIAHMWFDLAAANNNLGSARHRDALANLMTPAQIAEAQALAHRCYQSQYRECVR